MWGTGSKAARRESPLGRYFPDCEAHQREGAAAYLAAEQMRRERESPMDLDISIGDLLPHLTEHRRPPRDSLDAIELQIALEEELGQKDLAKVAGLQLADESVMKRLLGPAVESSQWHASTIWVRSLRGIVYERLRHSGGCACGDAPSISSMKEPTRSAQR